MNRRLPPALLVTLLLSLTGCAAKPATPVTATPAPAAPAASAAPAAPSRLTSPKTSSGADRPSKAAQMICGPETQANVARLMALKASPPTKATWADHVYTCSYQLAVGTLVLSVKESPDVSTARTYLNELRRRLGSSKPLTGMVGLGLPAFESRSGTVLFLKDNATLEVNASTLPQRIGPDRTPRGDLAYAVATSVLACWTE